MATLTDGTNVISPDLVLGWNPGRPVNSTVHPIIGWPIPDTVLATADVRSGTLELFFMVEASAVAAQSLLSSAAVWTLSSPSLRFVVAGGGDVTLEAVGQDLNRWKVTAPYVEQP